MQSANKREQCYVARDAYHVCLDKQDANVDLNCDKFHSEYEGACPPSWVTYFEKLRLKNATLQQQVDVVMSRRDKL